MANEQNLHKIRSVNEARKKGHNGGIASGEARRQKKHFCKILETLIQMPAANANELMTEFPGLTNITYKDALAIALLKKALDCDYRAIEKVLTLLDQNKSCWATSLEHVLGLHETQANIE